MNTVGKLVLIAILSAAACGSADLAEAPGQSDDETNQELAGGDVTCTQTVVPADGGTADNGRCDGTSQFRTNYVAPAQPIVIEAANEFEAQTACANWLLTYGTVTEYSQAPFCGTCPAGSNGCKVVDTWSKVQERTDGRFNCGLALWGATDVLYKCSVCVGTNCSGAKQQIAPFTPPSKS